MFGRERMEQEGYVSSAGGLGRAEVFWMKYLGRYCWYFLEEPSCILYFCENGEDPGWFCDSYGIMIVEGIEDSWQRIWVLAFEVG